MKTIAGLLLAFAIVLGIGSPAGADVGAADRAAIQSVISAQIEAFRRDDGAAAYGLASPNIHSLFPSVDRFMAMVKSGYRPVYRPRSVTFGAVSETPTGPAQKVFVTGPDGRDWVAIYTLERQPDGSWKINGCTLVEDDGAAI